MYLRSSFGQHAFGIIGQVSAALPLLIITSILSRSEGLERAGEFIILAGLAAAVYAASLWGFRTSVVIDGFQTFSPQTYVLGRIAALTIAAMSVGISAYLFQFDWELAAIIIIFRTIDAVIDLDFGFMQVWRGTAYSIQSFAKQHIFKLAVVASGIAIYYLSNWKDSYYLLMVIGCLVLVVIVLRFKIALKKNVVQDTTVSLDLILALYRSSFWLAFATITCAVLTSSPRFSLKWLYGGELLGVIGISLSVCTLFGMVFYTSWIRFLPQLEKSDQQRKIAFRYISETLFIGIFLMLISWVLLPPIVSFVFGYSYTDYGDITRVVLVCGITFSGCMNIMNLYKVTRVKWMESVTYIFILLFATMTAVMFPFFRSTPQLLWLAGIIMLVSGLYSFVFLVESKGKRIVNT